MTKKLSLIFGVFLVAWFFALLNSPHASAATLTNLSDTITTSRPSAATPLSANAASTVTSISVFNNGSRFLASDSAKIMRTSTAANIVSSLTIATQSSALTTVYFTASTGTATQNGTDVLIANQTAMHTISFITANAVASGGKIVITFPGSGVNTASPSASTFSFNGSGGGGSVTGVVKINGVTCSAITATAPAITCTTSALLSAGTTVTVLVGCSTASGASCTTQSPFLINPTKTSANGTADTWSVNVQTQDSGSVLIDQGTTKIGTVESVLVRASVDPSFTFTIGGLDAGASVKLGNATACTTTDTVNTGFASLPDVVDLGSLPVNISTINTSAQLISIVTNADNGYTLTATSSGQLIDKSSGFAIASSTAGSAFPSIGANSAWFGVRACGADANTGLFGVSSANTTRGSAAIYAWPTQTTAITLSSKSTGPIFGTAATNGLTTVEYAGAAGAETPSGQYTTAITYVATPIF